MIRHLALAVSDRERSRRFYETYLGFGTHPACEYDDGVLMLYDGRGFALALGPFGRPESLPPFLHFGIGLPGPDAVRAFRDRLMADGVPIVEEWDEPEYVSVKFHDPDGYVVEAAWQPHDRRVGELVPADFAVPAGLEHETFRLRMLSVADAEKDFEALNERVDYEGRRQPPFVPTLDRNVVDLGWHEKEFEVRRSFAYTVVDPDESVVLGCVYLEPSPTHDVKVWLWVRQSAWDEGLDPVLEATVREWVAADWPFTTVDWGKRTHPPGSA